MNYQKQYLPNVYLYLWQGDFFNAIFNVYVKIIS